MQNEIAKNSVVTLNYTVRDTDAAAYLVTDDVLRQEDAAVFIESMSSSKHPATQAQISE